MAPKRKTQVGKLFNVENKRSLKLIYLASPFNLLTTPASLED